jgi:hypothetical protein
VGAYRIGLSTLQEVLGADTNKARQRLSAQGLSCEFNEGALLTAITVTSPDYAFANGLSVGCSAADVRSKTGEPLGTSFQTDKLKFNALVYERMVFLLDDAESVYAIRIGK